MADGEDVKPKFEGGDESINLTVKDAQGGQVVFKVRPSTKLEKVFQAFCEKKSWDRAAVRFTFDGGRLQSDKTPADYGMEDEDTIDAMIEQLGGACH